jgi:hypothetical protein
MSTLSRYATRYATFESIEAPTNEQNSIAVTTFEYLGSIGGPSIQHFDTETPFEPTETGVWPIYLKNKFK